MIAWAWALLPLRSWGTNAIVELVSLGAVVGMLLYDLVVGTLATILYQSLLRSEAGDWPLLYGYAALLDASPQHSNAARFPGRK